MPSWALGATYFRLQDESSFVRLFRLSGGNTWRAQFKDGQVWEFGVPTVGSGLYTLAPEDAPIDRHTNGQITRWNVARKFEVYSGTGPASMVVYGWQHPNSTPAGVLVDVFATPPINGGALTAYAHHVNIQYTPYYTDTQNLSGRKPPVWRGQQALGVSQIDVTAKGAASGARSLVREYQLTRASDLPATQLTLTGITTRGACASDTEDANYRVQTNTCGAALSPGLTFESSQPIAIPWFEQRILPSAAVDGPPAPQSALQNPDRETVVDVDGDGLADIVESHLNSSGWYYGGSPGLYLNRRTLLWGNTLEYNNLTFNSPASDTDTLLSGQGLSIPSQWTTDGAPTVLWRPQDNPNTTTAYPYYYVHISGQRSHTWSMTRDTSPWASVTGLALTGDIDGDGLPDGLFRNNTLCLSMRSNFTKGVVPFSSAGGCYALSPPITLDPAHAPYFVGLVDMNGDGNLDYVFSDSLVYDSANPLRRRMFFVAGDGDHAFSAPAQSALVDSSGNSIYYDLSGQRKIYFGDVTGDGMAEVVILTPTSSDTLTVSVYSRNLVDGKYALLWEDTNTADSYATVGRAAIADVDGSGVNQLVLLGTGYARFFDFHYQAPAWADAPRPGLLTKVKNAYGAETTFAYTTAADAEAHQALDTSHPWNALGRWDRHSPLPQIVVSRMEARQTLPAPVGETRVTTYDYRNLIYDPWVGRNVGFELVRATEVGDNDNQPSLVTETTNFVGPCPPRDGDSSCSGSLQDYTYRGLVGRPVLVEQFDPEHGQYLSTTHIAYRRTALYTSSASSATAAFIYPSQVDTFVYDTAATGGSSTWLGNDVDDVAVRTVPIRRTGGGTAHLRRTRSFDSVGNLTSNVDYGRIHDDGTLIDRPIRTTLTAGLVSATGSGDWIWRTRTSSVAYDAGGEEAALGPEPSARQLSYTFDTLGRLTDVAGLLAGTVPLQRKHATGLRVAPAPTGASADGWITLAHYVYDSWNALTRVQGPTGECRDYGFAADADYHLYSTETTEYLGGCGVNGLTSNTSWDSRFGLPIQSVDPSGIQHSVQLDSLGRVVAIFGPSATTAYQTQLDATIDYLVNASGIQVVRVQKSQAPGGQHYIYLDGFGRPFLSLQQADATDPFAWVASGLPEKTTRGTPWLFSRPWAWAGTDPLNYPIAAPATRSAYRKYDALSRPTVSAYESVYGPEVRYHGLSTETWDADDLDPTSPHYGTPSYTYFDGHGRVRRTEVTQGADTVYTSIGYTAQGEVNGLVKGHSSGAETFDRWMRYDSLGRLVENAEPHATANYASFGSSSTNLQGWRYAYDPSGRLLGTSDARGCGENLVYDKGGRLLYEDYSPCLASHADYSQPSSTSGNGTEVYFTYDAPEAGQTTDYGNPQFLRGRITSIRDRGAHTRFAYDGRARVTSVARRMAGPTPADSFVGRYANHWFHKTTTYDDQDRVWKTQLGSEARENPYTRLEYEYSLRGYVSAIGTNLGPLVDNQYVDETGQLSYRLLADAAFSYESFWYDGNHRLTEHSVSRATLGDWSTPTPTYTPDANGYAQPTLLMDDWITYDAAGNVARIDDLRTPTEWPAGAAPYSRGMSYDDLYRLTRVDYTSPGGDTTQVSPFAAEEAVGNSLPVPQRQLASRVAWQSYDFDWFGNTTSVTDDSNATFDRSLGAVANSTSGGKRGQLLSSTQVGGQTSAAYDVAGNLIDLTVARDGNCGSVTSKCFQRYSYDWDEVGQLARARRWDFAALSDMPAYPTIPGTTPSVTINYGYGLGGRARRSVTDSLGTTKHDVTVYDTLELRQADFSTATVDYEQTVFTEHVELGGAGQLVYDPSLPSFTGRPMHAFLRVSDQLGSGAVMLDQDTGELVERTQYQPFGATETDYRPARWGSFRDDARFTGKSDDSEVGLSYFGARYLSAPLGRWISADPLTVHGAGSDLNPYAYVRGRTFNAVDPLGLSDCTENQCAPANTSIFGDLDGWANAAKAVGHGFASAAEWAGNAFSDGWDSVKSFFGGSSSHHRPGAPHWAGAAQSVSAGLSALNPTISSTGTLTPIITTALSPGSFFTTRGIALQTAHTALTAAKFGYFNVGLMDAALGVNTVEGLLPRVSPLDVAGPVTNAAIQAGVGAVPAIGAFGRGVLGAAAEMEAAVGQADALGGAGGSWPVIGETPGGAIGQQTPLSCGAACGEMVTGIPQSSIIQKAGAPTSAGALGDAIGWRGGATNAPASQLLNLRGPWIAELRSGPGGLSHFVVVDGAQGGNVLVRDPWAGGSTYQMTIDAFTTHWTTRVVIP